MARLNLVFIDEAAYVPEGIIKEVIIPMLIVAAGYVVGSKAEERRSNKLVMSSTASYRVNHLYKTFCAWTKMMVKPDNKDYFTLTLPWQVGVRAGLHKESFIMQQKATMNNDKFEMEYLGIFPKLINGVWIEYEDLVKCSDLKHIEMQGVDDFEYVMSVDVARVEGGDNSIINVFKLHNYKDHIEADHIYTFGMNGVKFADQATVIRKIMMRYKNVIRIFMDSNGLGVGLADELSKDYYDEETETWYPPLTDINNPEHKNIPNGQRIIYGFKATAELNHNMGMAIKTFTQKHWLHMYPMSVDENRKVDLSMEEELLVREAEETRMEILNIKNRPITGSVYVKFYSTSKRKDRWSAMCMGLYGIELLRKEREKKNKGTALIAVAQR